MSNKLKTIRRKFTALAMITMAKCCRWCFLSLLLWFAVCDDVEDILEQQDTVQVSEKTGESVFIKILLATDICSTYVG